MSFSQFVRSTRMIHLAIIMGACMMFIVFYFVIGIKENNGQLPFPETIFVALALIPWFGSRIIYRSQIRKAINETDTWSKLAVYRTGLIMALAVSEGITLMCIVIYFFLFPATTLLFVIGVGMVSMFSLMPSERKIMTELNLNGKDVKNLP